MNNIEHEFAQRHILGVVRMRGGVQPGHFTTNLIEAMFRADEENMERLRLGFPVLVGAMLAYQHGTDIDNYPIIKAAVEAEHGK